MGCNAADEDAPLPWYAPYKSLKLIPVPRQSNTAIHFRNKRDTAESPNEDRFKRERLMLDKLTKIQSWLQERSANSGHNPPNDSNPVDLLDQVLEEVETLEVSPKKGEESDSTDCDINGQWISEAAGGIFNISLTGESIGQDMPIRRKRAHDHVHDGFMNFKDWSTMLRQPYANNTQYLVMTAVNDRSKIVATFMGECRVCRGRELIQGSWLIVSHSRDCESIGSTAKLIGEVLRRDNIEGLRKHQTKHLSALNSRKNVRGSKKAETETTLKVTEAAIEAFPKSTKKAQSAKPTNLHFKLH